MARTLDTLRRRGFGRLLMDDKAVAFDEVDPAALKGRPAVEVVVDRVKVEDGLLSRLTDSVETSYREGGGAAFALVLHEGGATERVVFSERFECRTCGIGYETPQPRLFSFNNPFGACPTCNGFGNVIELDMQLVVPDASKSLTGGAVEPWTKPHYRSHLAELKREARKTSLQDGRALARPERRRAPDGPGGLRGLRRRPRVLPLARAQEIQGARPRVPEPVSQLPGVPGLRRRAAAARGAGRPGGSAAPSIRCRR